MTLVEKKNGESQITLVDLTAQSKLSSLGANAARFCAFLGKDAVAYSDGGVRVRGLLPNRQGKELTLESKEVACIDVLSIGSGQYLLAVGNVEGRVSVWQLDLRTQEWSDRRILDRVAHEGPVTSIVFQSPTTLASSSSDRSIALTTWGQGSDVTERHLKLKLRCKGMKIEGLRTEIERAQLAKLIEEADGGAHIENEDDHRTA